MKSWSAITMLIRGSNALTVVNVTAILGKDIALRYRYSLHYFVSMDIESANAGHHSKDSLVNVPVVSM